MFSSYLSYFSYAHLWRMSLEIESTLPCTPREEDLCGRTDACAEGPVRRRAHVSDSRGCAGEHAPGLSA